MDHTQKTDEQPPDLIKPPPSTDEDESVPKIREACVGDSEGSADFDRLTKGSQKYESAEHEFIAKGVHLYTINEEHRVAIGYECYPVKTGGWLSKKTITLNFGRIIALAGDYYSTWEKGNNDRVPICGAFFKSSSTSQERFRTAVDSLIFDKDGFLDELTNILQGEYTTVDHVHSSGESVSQAYHTHACGIPTDRALFMATRGKWSQLSLYAWLGYINADHFGWDAVTAYKVGHGVAMEQAAKAGGMTNDEDKKRELNLAYTYEAFSAHYLSDLFSAGHLRAPRRQLHGDSYKVASESVIPCVKGMDEIPVWDHHSRYMHDDDSATGLLVTNNKGHQWIAYGDKQFLETRNAVNRFRVQHCLQASIDELFHTGFKKRDDLSKTGAFKALDLLPRPMTAVKEDKWPGYDMHNSAPLWCADKDQPGDNDFTCREDLNDHSDYSRKQGSPAPKHKGWVSVTANDLSESIQQAAFRKEDQFPKSTTINGLRSGGFIQVQDLEIPGSRATCANFWSPATIKLPGGATDTFTLRSRMADLVSPDAQSSLPLHWAKWYDGKATELVRFSWTKNSGAGGSSIAASKYRIVDHQPTEKGDVPELDPRLTRDWSFTSSTIYDNTKLLDLQSPNVEATNLTRFLFGTFTENSGRDNPEIIVVSLSGGNEAQVVVCAAYNDLHALSSSSYMVRLPVAEGPYNFVKAFKTSSSRADVLLAKTTWSNGSTIVDFTRLSVSSSKEPVVTNDQFNFPSKQPILGSSVLVGDVFGNGSSHAVVLSGDFETPNVRTYGLSPNSPQLECTGQHTKYKLHPSKDLVRPYIRALVPSDPTGKDVAQGLDVLQVSLHKQNDKHHLRFSLHRRSRAAPGKESNVWDACKTSKPIPDPLADNPYYFHIKWLRCWHSSNRNALMEVFSFHGILGVRVFAAANEQEPWAYEQVGCQPYMGQTSVGAGLGSYGDWGQGILTWGDSEDFVDESVWRPKVKGSWNEGLFGMGVVDMQRPNIRGWRVKERPW